MRSTRASAVALQGRVPLRAIHAAVRRRERALPHLGRKLYHFAMGMMCFTLYAFILTREQALLLLGTVGGAFVVLDALRFRSPYVRAMALRLLGNVMRREELRRLSANSYYVLGLLTITFLFPKPIVLLAVLFLAIGDPAASIVGTRWGKTRLGLFGSKSLEGALANGAASFLAATAFAHFYLGQTTEKAVVVGILGAFASVVAELLPLPIDDNFTVPVFSSIILAALSQTTSLI